MTNIGDVIDPFYRYKRPVSVVEFKPNNKIIILNINEIAIALGTKPNYILYYIQLEKSAPITPKGEIKGKLTKDEIEGSINKFINEYVLCQKCLLPELDIKGSRKQLYFLCRACGHSMDIKENKFTKIMYKDFK